MEPLGGREGGKEREISRHCYRIVRAKYSEASFGPPPPFGMLKLILFSPLEEAESPRVLPRVFGVRALCGYSLLLVLFLLFLPLEEPDLVQHFQRGVFTSDRG